MIRRRNATCADECFDSWVAWRAACTTVEEAYHSWLTATKAQRPLAFSMYRDALAREEERADRHAAQVAQRLGSPVDLVRAA